MAWSYAHLPWGHTKMGWGRAQLAWGHIKLVQGDARLARGHAWLSLVPYLGGEVLHQGHHGVLEERASGQWAFGDFGDALLAIRPHGMQHGVRTGDSVGVGLAALGTLLLPHGCATSPPQLCPLCPQPVVEEPFEVLEERVLVLVQETFH